MAVAPVLYMNISSLAAPEPGGESMSSRSRSTRVSAHKFTVGQTVYFTGAMLGRANAGGGYRVVRLLPPDGGDFQYRIKSATEAYERVAKESQLERDH
jgi:hypothetical protein